MLQALAHSSCGSCEVHVTFSGCRRFRAEQPRQKVDNGRQWRPVLGCLRKRAETCREEALHGRDRGHTAEQGVLATTGEPAAQPNRSGEGGAPARRR